MSKHIHKPLRALVPFFPSSGGAPIRPGRRLIMRLVRIGCVNRPCHLISVMEEGIDAYEPTVEQVGSYDPLPNAHNEKVVALNYERINHWLKQGVTLSPPVANLLGLAGYLPISPYTYKEAWRRRKALIEQLEELRIEAKKIESQAEAQTEEAAPQ